MVLKIKKDNLKIFTGLKYGIIFPILILVCMLVLAMFPYLLQWDMSSIFFVVIWYLIVILGCIYSIITFLLYYQTALFNEKGIYFKSLLSEIGSIEWADVKEICIKNTPTLLNSFGFYTKYNWIFICRETYYEPKTYKEINRNKKNQSQFMILYKVKTCEILISYCKKYCPDLNIDSLLVKHTEKPKTKWGHW